MKKVLLFGAGKSATVLIDYLLENAEKENWQLTVVDADLQLARSKIGNSSYGLQLNWFADRSTETLPQASALSLPLWVYKVLMLAWALWLANAVIGWLREAYTAWTRDGYWRVPAKKAAVAPALEATPPAAP